MTRPTFDGLARLEPELDRLRRYVRSLGGQRRFCASQAWYEPFTGIKAQVMYLVGWCAPPDASAELRTPEAYDTACHSLVADLPPCRGRICDCDPTYIQRNSARLLKSFERRTA